MITKTLYTGTEINKVVLFRIYYASKAVISGIAIGPEEVQYIYVL
jgi:hypothetical protein